MIWAKEIAARVERIADLEKRIRAAGKVFPARPDLSAVHLQRSKIDALEIHLAALQKIDGMTKTQAEAAKLTPKTRVASILPHTAPTPPDAPRQDQPKADEPPAGPGRTRTTWKRQF